MTIYEKYKLMNEKSEPLVFYDTSTDEILVSTPGFIVKLEYAKGKYLLADLGGISYLENLEYIGELCSYYENKGIEPFTPKPGCLCNMCNDHGIVA